MTISHAPAHRIVIVGGTGKVAHHLILKLRSQGDEAVAVFRDSSRSEEIVGLGATPVVLDIESASVADLAGWFAGADAVVFAAGAGGGDPQRTRSVDFEAAVRTMRAATDAAVSRFVMVSAMGAGGPIPTEGDMVDYYRAKHDADKALESSGLEWTILRPGALTDDPGTGSVTLDVTVPKGSVARDDVASVIVSVLGNDSSIGAAWEFTTGSETIAEAVSSAGAGSR